MKLSDSLKPLFTVVSDKPEKMVDLTVVVILHVQVSSVDSSCANVESLIDLPHLACTDSTRSGDCKS